MSSYKNNNKEEKRDDEEEDDEADEQQQQDWWRSKVSFTIYSPNNHQGHTLLFPT